MVRYRENLIKRAIKMAVEKELSYKEIGRKLGVSDSTVSIWCRDVKGSNPRTYVKNSKNLRELIKKSEQVVFKNFRVTNNLAKIFCGIIYGCEGSKYPASNCVAFTNSEPGLVKSFVNLLRISYKLDESKWRVHLQIHSNQDFARLATYWSKLLKVSVSRFYKPTITVAKEGKHRTGYCGTCTVKYYDYKLQLKLIGVYEQFMRKSSMLEGMPNG
jgi:predicted transcriptional regulator